ncbi:MAG TPA: xanthine dehydrogenase family protein subunit M [Anaerolineae bacterium]|nr:xanthine dehydrogenase family protein subunit M [Anaerolineae bacterium]
MKPAPFKYERASSLPATLDLLKQHGYDAKLLAGGQSLIPAMNFRLAQPAVLIDINPLPELNHIGITPDHGLTIGAMTRQRHIETSPHVAQYAPLLAETMPYIAHPQIRNRGTLGGSLVHSDPAAELPVIAVTLDAKLHIHSHRGDRWVAARDFFMGMFVVDLQPEEILTAVHFPAWPARTGYAFTEVARRPGDYALVGAAATLSLDHNGRCRAATLVYLNVGDGPMLAEHAAASLVNEIPTPKLIEDAAALAASKEIDPVGNIHASIGYQRHLAQVLGRRVLTQALTRAQQASQGGSS